jgi:hypothetical protein
MPTILIERSMVNRADARSVRHLGSSGRLGVSDDVRWVQQPDLLQPADRTLVSISRDHEPAEAPLVHPHFHLAIGVPALDRVER